MILLAEKCILNSLKVKRSIRLFWILLFQIFRSKLNIIVCGLKEDFKTSVKASIDKLLLLETIFCTKINTFLDIEINFSYIYICTYIYIYIYMCVYIYIHSQTDCFVVIQFFSVARHVVRLKLGPKPAQLYVKLNIILLSQQAKHVSSVNHKALCCGFRLFTFYTLPDTSVLNSFEELFFMRVATVNSFAWVKRIKWMPHLKRMFPANYKLTHTQSHTYMCVCVCVCVKKNVSYKL